MLCFIQCQNTLEVIQVYTCFTIIFAHTCFYLLLILSFIHLWIDVVAGVVIGADSLASTRLFKLLNTVRLHLHASFSCFWWDSQVLTASMLTHHLTCDPWLNTEEYRRHSHRWNLPGFTSNGAASFFKVHSPALHLMTIVETALFLCSFCSELR